MTRTTTAPLSIVFLDIDHFKLVNDNYGHDAGDYVLKELAKVLLAIVRQGDFIARWGGEEFVITLQSADINQALQLAEKIRVSIDWFVDLFFPRDITILKRM